MNCTKDWYKMTSIESESRKKFCDTCQECVHDFKGLTIPEIEGELKTMEDGFCCRIETSKYKIIRKRKKWKKRLGSVGATLIFTSLFLGSGDLQGQNNENTNDYHIEYMESEGNLKISGKVKGILNSENRMIRKIQ